MGTTLTLDDDVAVQLERLRRSRNRTLREAVHDALRRGLREMTGRPDAPRMKYRTPTADLGRCLVGSIESVSAALAVEHGLTLCTADAGFSRFAGLRYSNPLAGK